MGCWQWAITFPAGSRKRAVISGASAPMGWTISPPLATSALSVAATQNPHPFFAKRANKRMGHPAGVRGPRRRSLRRRLPHLQQLLQVAGTVDYMENEDLRPSNSVEEKVLGKTSNRRPPHIAKFCGPESAESASSWILDDT